MIVVMIIMIVLTIIITMIIIMTLLQKTHFLPIKRIRLPHLTEDIMKLLLGLIEHNKKIHNYFGSYLLSNELTPLLFMVLSKMPEIMAGN